MAFEGPQVRIPGLVAGANLSALQYTFVKLSGDLTVVGCAAATDKPVGVLQNAPADGQEATVCAMGVTKIVGGADLDAGDSIGTHTNGRAVKYSASDTTKYIVGQVLEGNSADGGIVTAFVSCVGRTLA